MATPEFLGRIKNPASYLEDESGNPQTHLMRAEYNPDSGEWIAFPTIVGVGGNKLMKYPEQAWREAMRNAIATNNYISFGKDKHAALEYASGAYKKGTPLEMTPEEFRKKYKQQNGVLE